MGKVSLGKAINNSTNKEHYYNEKPSLRIKSRRYETINRIVFYSIKIQIQIWLFEFFFLSELYKGRHCEMDDHCKILITYWSRTEKLLREKKKKNNHICNSIDKKIFLKTWLILFLYLLYYISTYIQIKKILNVKNWYSLYLFLNSYDYQRIFNYLQKGDKLRILIYRFIDQIGFSLE